MKAIQNSLYVFVSLLISMMPVFEISAAEQTYNFKTPAYTTDLADNIHHLGIQEYYSYPVPGYPDLPTKIYRFAIPPDAIEESIKVEYVVSNTKELGKFNIAEVHPMVTWKDGKEIIGEKADVYSINAFFPKNVVEYLGCSQMRKWKIVNFRYTPFQYNPVTSFLKTFSGVNVTIKYEQNKLREPGPDIDDDVMDSRAEGMLNNFSEGYDWYKPTGKTVRGSKQDYVIITTNAIKAASTKLNNDFKNYLTSKGYSPLVVTETDYGNLQGQLPNSKADKIRKWLQDHYIAMGIKYVLLIGNPDPVNGDVPMKMCQPEADGEKTPTDYYYADLTGNWDKNGNGIFGEYSGDSVPGGVDFQSDVYVGRIPVYNKVSDLDSVLSKTIAYGNSTDIGWRKNILLPMGYISDTIDSAYLSEAMIKDYLTSNGFSFWKMYNQGSLCPKADSIFSSNEELRGGKVKERWKSNKYGLVWWSGHGSSTDTAIGYDGCGWERYLLSHNDTSELNDNYPSFVFQGSCNNGYPEQYPDGPNAPHYSNVDIPIPYLNLGTALLYNGAITTVSASRESFMISRVWLTTDKYFCDNASIGYYYGKELMANKKTAGESLFAVKSEMGNNYLIGRIGSDGGYGLKWKNLFNFNLYGDPSISINETTTGPANNSFVSATTISGMSGQTSGSNDRATKETGEPNHAGNSGGKSVWWKWTAPQSGYFNFDTHGSTLNTLLAIYTGSGVGSLTPIVSNDDDKSANNASGLVLQAQAGTQYYIAIDGYNGAFGSIILNWGAAVPSSIQISGASSLNENSEAQYSCTATYGDGTSVDVSNKATWSENSSYASISSIGYLTASAVSSNQSVIITAAYQGVNKTYPVTITDVPTLPNDGFSYASVISGGSGQIKGFSNTLATKEIGEPNHAGNPGGKSVWWKWTASATVDVFIDTHGSDFDTVLAVYKGSSLTALTEVASNDNYAGGTITSSLMFSAQSGITYYIAVDGAGGSSGNVVLNWKVVTPASLAITGLSQLNEGNSAQYTAMVYYTDASSANVSSKTTWTENCGSASINTGGYLSTGEVTANQSCTITASYQGKTAAYNITIVNISNDNFTGAFTIAGTSSSVTGSNANATKESGEQSHEPAGNAGGKSLWWKWTAPQSGYMLFDTHGSDFDTLLAVYTGTSLSSLSKVASNDDDGSPGNTSGVVVQVQSGTTYYIAVDGYDGVTGNIVLNWKVPVADNDNFINAKILTGLKGIDSGFNVSATKELGEPNHAGITGGRSVWWKWTPSVSSWYAIDTSESNIGTVLLAVYTGNSVTGLTEIVNNYDYLNYSFNTSVQFLFEAGTTYYIAVDGYNGEQGSISLAWYGLPPLNDNLAGAWSLSGVSGRQYTGDNFSATKEDYEPNHSKGSGGSSAWWKWTAPQSGRFSFDTHGSDFDTLLGIYTGTSVGALSEAASNDDDGSSGNNSGASFSASGGTQYYIAVDGYGGIWGNITLNWGLETSTSNDNFMNAAAISGSSGQISASNQFATKEDWEPYHAGNQGGKSLWWKWTAPETSYVTFDNYGSDFSGTLIAVYTGTSLYSLTEVASFVNNSGVTFLAQYGITYYIAVDSYYDNGVSIGNIVLNWKKASPPPNDNFGNAATLSGTSGQSFGTNTDATSESGEPSSLKRSVWWKWTAPQNGSFSFDTHGCYFDTFLAVYSGSDIYALSEVASNDDSGSDGTSEVSFQAQIGKQYYIVVTGYRGSVGNIVLNWKAIGGAAGIAGDLNGDSIVDLADAITGLRVVCGIPVALNISGDVNGDGKVSLEEVVYILQTVAGLR